MKKPNIIQVRMRSFRASTGLSQAQASKATGVAYSNWRDWEQGTTEPRALAWLAAEKAMGAYEAKQVKIDDKEGS